MRRNFSILLITLMCGGLAANAQAGIALLRGVSSAERAIRAETGQERAQQAVGLQYAAADLRHI